MARRKFDLPVDFQVNSTPVYGKFRKRVTVTEKIFFFSNQHFPVLNFFFPFHNMYLLGMRNELPETTEKLIRVRASRRGVPVELRVHYETTKNAGGVTIQLFSVEDAD
jgi:hypothetical protein